MAERSGGREEDMAEEGEKGGTIAIVAQASRMSVREWKVGQWRGRPGGRERSGDVGWMAEGSSMWSRSANFWGEDWTFLHI